MLRSYPTTLEEDADVRRKLIEEQQKPDKKAPKPQQQQQIKLFCLTLRMGEKRILMHVEKLCKDSVK